GARAAPLAAERRLPAMYANTASVEAGGLMAYAPNIAVEFRRAATYVDKILKGAKPADLPVEQPREVEVVVNLKTAQALGLNIPQQVLLQATEVLQSYQLTGNPSYTEPAPAEGCGAGSATEAPYAATDRDCAAPAGGGPGAAISAGGRSPGGAGRGGGGGGGPGGGRAAGGGRRPPDAPPGGGGGRRGAHARARARGGARRA